MKQSRNERAIERMARNIALLQRKSKERLDQISRQEQRIEQTVTNLRTLTIRKSYLLETTRAAAGASLGVSVGMGLRLIPEIARELPWFNVAGIFLFIMFIALVLIYRTERVVSQTRIAAKLLELLAISVFVEIAALALFNILPQDAGTLAKVLVVGLFPTMSGAITFRVIE